MFPHQVMIQDWFLEYESNASFFCWCFLNIYTIELIEPLSKESSHMHRNNVVFPEPEGPITKVSDPVQLQKRYFETVSWKMTYHIFNFKH